MLNKKAIAAFAAGATLLSGLAFAAPSFAENNTPATEDNISDLAAKVAQEVKDAKSARENATNKKADADKAEGEKKAAHTDKVKAVLDENGAHLSSDNTYQLKDGVVSLKTGTPSEEQTAVISACNTYLAKVTAYNNANAAAGVAETEAKAAEAKRDADQAKLASLRGQAFGDKQALADATAAVAESLANVKNTYKAAVEARKTLKADKAALKKAEKALSNFEDSASAKTKKTTEYRTKHSELKKAVATAKKALEKAQKADEDAYGAYQKAVADHVAPYGAYVRAFNTANVLGYADNAKDPSEFEYVAADHDIDADAATSGNTGTGEEGKGGEGEGGSSEHHDKNKGKITPEEAKALAEFAVKYVKDSKSDPKTVKALAAALAKVTAAKKAKDAKALVSALKELKALVEPLMKKAPAKDTGKALESIFGSDVLYTKYKGLAVDLIKLGVTNIGAYDGLLNQLEFGLSRFGWDNVVKNFPEHGPHNNCDFLAWLRRHLTKAVAHYGHVEAAVKDVQAELNEDMKDAQARHDWDAVKVIDQKITLANGLREVAHHNLTRAKALLNSANDHAKDLSCDTAAKEVRAAMDKEPNSPFKKSGQKHDSQKPNGQNGQKPNGGAAGHTLGKTGATVALVAVAASVLAGMGAALRKIRH